MSPFDLVPWWARLLAVAGLIVAVWTHGYVRGQRAGDRELATFKTQVAVEGAKAEAHVTQVIAKQQEVNRDVVKDYKNRIAAIKSRPVSLPEQRPDGGQVATISCPATGTDGKPADPVPTVAKSDFDTLYGLASETTQQLISLQAWIRQQQTAFQ